MSQSIAKIWVHLIFSTKGRSPFLSNGELRHQMHAYVAGSCQALHCSARIVNGTADHVHILCLLGRTITVSDLVLGIKRSSSIWIKDRGGILKKFAWQAGYAAFSVSPSRLAAAERYIANQEEHHRKLTFQEEVLKFFEEYQVDYDERHLWD